MTCTRRATWIFLGAGGLLPGCVISPSGSHYRPTADRGVAKAVRAFCGGKAGPDTGLRLDLGAGLVVELGSVLDPGSLSGLSIRLDVEVPARTELAVAGPIRILNDDQPTDARLTDPLQGVRTGGPAERWQAGEALKTGSSAARLTMQTFLRQPGQRVRILWPSTRLNGQPFTWPEVVFERRRLGVGIEPLNC